MPFINPHINFNGNAEEAFNFLFEDPTIRTAKKGPKLCLWAGVDRIHRYAIMLLSSNRLADLMMKV